MCSPIFHNKEAPSTSLHLQKKIINVKTLRQRTDLWPGKNKGDLQWIGFKSDKESIHDLPTSFDTVIEKNSPKSNKPTQQNKEVTSCGVWAKK